MKKEWQMDNYEPPKVEVIEVEVEKGFALSSGTSPIGIGDSDWQEGNSYGY